MGIVKIIGVRNPEPRSRGLWALFSLLKVEKRVRVDMNARPYWAEQGWSQRGNSFQGNYKTRFGSWRGQIVNRKYELEVYIFEPPKALQKNPHWECFFEIGHSKFQIHLIKHPEDVDSAIFHVQRMIEEAYDRRA